jgi:hypothetical protein
LDSELNNKVVDVRSTDLEMSQLIKLVRG